MKDSTIVKVWKVFKRLVELFVCLLIFPIGLIRFGMYLERYRVNRKKRLSVRSRKAKPKADLKHTATGRVRI